MKTQSTVQPNLAEAIKFLNALAGKESEIFVFQAFDDNQSEGAEKRHALTKVMTGTFAEHADALTKLNQSGAGIFVQVNVANGKGRKAADITALRAVFIDKDDGDIGEMKIKPSILVQTKHGQHAFWKLVPGESLADFTSMQKALIHHLKTDKSVHNLDRLMRLPGFFHQKDPADPFMVMVKETNDVSYSMGDMVSAYPAPEPKPKKKNVSAQDAGNGAGDMKLDKFKKWIDRLPKGKGGRNSTVVKIVREGLGNDISEESLRQIVEDYCEASDLPIDEGMAILDRHLAEHEFKNFEPYIDLNRSQAYEVKSGKIFWNKPTNDGSTAVPLCNFTAKIVKEEIHDDGVETRRFFQIDGAQENGRPLPQISIPSEEYQGLNWVTKNWGQRAYVYVRASEHLRVAIQELSGAAEEVHIYKHTGWRNISGEYVYLHADGAIGANGANKNIQVDLKNGKLADYRMPTPPQGVELKTAVKSSLSLLTVAPKHVTFALLATAYRSVLSECQSVNFSVFISGPTGCFKSSLIGSVQAHFGAKFNTSYLPDNWQSTENSLEKKSFLLKDCIFTIDEWTPNGTHAEADKLRSKAERILRSQGNQSGRGRMTQTCDMRPEYYPRGIIISTGEDMPQGHSLRARTVQIEMSHGDVDKAKLAVLQNAATDGMLSQSMAAYIQWLAPQMAALKGRLPRLHKKMRDSIGMGGMHNRTPDITASLGVGLRMFLKFAVRSGAITQTEKNVLWKDGWNSLLKVAETQAGYQNTEDHANKFIGYIKYAINLGEAYIANTKDGSRAVDFGKAHNSQAKKIGWQDEDGIYLDPDAAIALVQQLSKQQNDPMPISKSTLWKRLAQKGLIAVSDTENRNLIKKVIEGRRMYVLMFPNKKLFLDLDKDDKKSNQGKPVNNGDHSTQGGVS